ncbi:MAG: DUF5067 domain-containing protein [Lachnospiraceae bacterium]|nr:DUF5067 domain-containing protein [Lachnospiraceae bacterium]
MAEEVKKIRRRRKKTPEEIKGGKVAAPAARASQAYSGHAQDVRKLKSEGLESVLQEKEEEAARAEAQTPAKRTETGYETTPGKPTPQVNTMPPLNAAPFINKTESIGDPQEAETERDRARRSALDSISTFSGAEPLSKKKEKKKAEPEAKPVVTAPQPEDDYEKRSETGEGPYRELKREYEEQEQKTGRPQYESRPEPRSSYAENTGNRPGTNTEAYIYEEERRSRARIIHIAILIVELIVLGIILYYLFHYRRLLAEGNFSAPAETESYSEAEDGGSDEPSEEAPSETTSARDSREQEEGGGGEQASININNDKFALKCTRLQITKDTDGNPAALLFFTFVNKTDISLSMSEVYPPLVVQDGIMCETFASIESPPEEFYNRDTRIQDGEGVDVCYSVKLQNTTSPVTLTIHDNYETYEDVAETTIKLQ